MSDAILERVRGELGKLSYRERLIIQLRYGLSPEKPFVGGDGYAYTRQEVARIFRVCRERIGKIEQKALQKLEKRLGDLSALTGEAE